MVSTLSDEVPPLADNPEAKHAPTPGPASSGTINNVGGLDKPTTSGAGTSEKKEGSQSRCGTNNGHHNSEL